MGYEQVWLSYNQLFYLFFLLFLCQITCLHAQLCTQKQNSALLQLKGTFSVNNFGSSGSTFCDASFPKMESWKKDSDCCTWDGVHCDRETGQVIGLDLSCSRLEGTFHPNSSFFLSFPHLQNLNLAGNDFLMSRISPEFTRFSELTHLNLSACWFSGKVPPGISFLNKLLSLDLSQNFDLRLEEGGFELLIKNLSKIIDLDLSFVNMSSSVVPNSLLNLTSLRTLHLADSGLCGNFPSGIFHLPHLQRLSLWGNEALKGYLPDFMNLRYPLQQLYLSGTGFSGVLPHSVVNLKSLEVLDVSSCKFHGSIPTSLFILTQITFLDLSSNNFSGILPSSISNLGNLAELYLQNNNFSGILPSSISNLSNLENLQLSDNNFNGILPSSISNLRNLEILCLNDNYFTGPLFSLSANLSKLLMLDVSNNRLTGPLPSQVIAPPNLIRLNIGQNLINGTIPSWVIKLPSLEHLNLSHNQLIGHILVFQSTSLWTIDLSYNNLHGTVPNSTFELPNLTGLILSSNSFSGTIPESNRFSKNLVVLELRKNNFSGTIHDSFIWKNRLKTINLNGNGFAGPIPESLVNCTNLEVLDLGKNKFFDKFPHWLGSLPNLRVLILQSNELHGSILTSHTKFPFSMLRVLDLSNNHFTGLLPIRYFKTFKAMMNVDEVNFILEYMRTYGNFTSTYYDSLTMVIKGSTTEMDKILTIFTAIDLSRNEFDGEIPEIIGGLNSIRGINLSHNSLTGHIPKSLGNLTKLEWLDLSSNKLSGEIPQQLTNLISLGTLNLSQNHLTGPIPQGKQFDTFSNDSYINNLALCGPPLSKTCSDPEATQPPPLMFGEGENSEPGSGFCWEVILPGYGFGLVIGLVMGYLMFSFGKPEWLVKMVEGVGNRNGKRPKNNAQRHGGRRN